MTCRTQDTSVSSTHVQVEDFHSFSTALPLVCSCQTAHCENEVYIQAIGTGTGCLHVQSMH